MSRELISMVIPPLAGHLPQVSGFPPISVWRVFGFVGLPSVGLGAGQTAESIRVQMSPGHGLAYAEAWAAASPVVFPMEVVEVTAREIQEEDRRERGARSDEG
ncbi:MAG: hypothetical protein ACE5JL_07390 [Dehalococcoidia bacterium]